MVCSVVGVVSGVGVGEWGGCALNKRETLKHCTTAANALHCRLVAHGGGLKWDTHTYMHGLKCDTRHPN